ncbi:hypothetical protein G6F42_027769 [Rhizopus arrhizus]|nr:hypothetical protein G6F42_027769 [Rhizopus arrhizus]
MYDRLDRSRMWKLSTGTVVEDTMRDVALSLDHEHPCHSLIMDITDACWSKVFEEEEMDEIRDYRSVELPLMSEEVESYLKQLQDLPASELYEMVDGGDFEMITDSNWIQKSYRDTFRLLRSNFFPLQAQTEVLLKP